MPGPGQKLFGVDLKGTNYENFSTYTENQILEMVNKKITTKKNQLDYYEIQRVFLEEKRKKGGLTREEKKLSSENPVKYTKSIWKDAANNVKADIVLKRLENAQRREIEQINREQKEIAKLLKDANDKTDKEIAPDEIDKLENENNEEAKRTEAFKQNQQTIIDSTNVILNKLENTGFRSFENQIRDIADTVKVAEIKDKGVDEYLKDISEKLKEFNDVLGDDEEKKVGDNVKGAEVKKDKIYNKDSVNNLQKASEALSTATAKYKAGYIQTLSDAGWDNIEQEGIEVIKPNTFRLKKEKHQIKVQNDDNILENINEDALDDNAVGRNAVHEVLDPEKEKEEEKKPFWKKVINKLKWWKKEELTTDELMTEVQKIEPTNAEEKKEKPPMPMGDFLNRTEKEKNKTEVKKMEEAEVGTEKDKNQELQKNIENEIQNNEQKDDKEKDKEKEIKNNDVNKNEDVNKEKIEESNVNVNRTAEQIQESEKEVLEEVEEEKQKANVEDNKKEAEKNDTQVKEMIDPVNQEKLDASLLAYEDQLNNKVATNQAVQSSMLQKNSTEASEADKQGLTESHKALEEKEADVRKYMPVKTDELNISVPKLIQDQMRLEAGQMTRDEKNQHFMNIIEMKGMDGDKYDKQLRDYGMKVAEEAGREFEKKHQDPAKLSFLNKSANAIETVMCAMSRNPLGIIMLLAAAMYAPLMMVGLLAFTAWKRKRPNPAYQNAWQEQNRRELEQKREQLANLYNVDASSISDREVTKALKADYVNAKIIDAMDAKLERDSRKAVDSIAKDYAKSISKESGTKYSAKDLKDGAKKDLLWKDRYEENAATLLTNREDKMWKAIEHHENEKKKAMGRSL